MNNKQSNYIYDVLIIGGGPAGLSAAIYAARSGLKFLLFSKEFGGQLNRTKIIENYSGVMSIEGYALSTNLLQHVKMFANDDQILRKHINFINKKNNIFEVITEEGHQYFSKFVLLCTGSKYKKLNVNNEDQYTNKGIGNCTICEGWFYQNKNIVIIGGGNSALSGALYMSNIAKNITIINKNNQFKGEKILLKQTQKKNNIKIIYNALTTSFIGNETELTHVKYCKDNTDFTIKVDGVFIKIGLKPNISILQNNILVNDYGEIIVDHSNMSTSIKGLYACGDIINNKYKQAIISSGEGAKAILHIKTLLQND